MAYKLENVNKDELIVMIKSLWIENKLKSIEKTSDNKMKIAQLECLAIETATEIDMVILNYFGYE